MRRFTPAELLQQQSQFGYDLRIDHSVLLGAKIFLMRRTSRLVRDIEQLKEQLKANFRRSASAKHLAKALRRFPLPERLWQRLSFHGPFDVALPEGESFRLWHGGHRVENEVFWKGIFGQWEKTSLEIWYKRAREARTIIDVGANSGVYSILAAAANPQATVLAVEPLPSAIQQLKRNIDLNGANVRVFEGVLSDRPRETTLHLAPSNFQYSASLNAGFSPELTESTSVVALTLDKLVEKYHLPNPDLIKIDVEGHEREVIHGMQNTLSSSSPEILVEVLDNDALSPILELLPPPWI